MLNYRQTLRGLVVGLLMGLQAPLMQAQEREPSSEFQSYDLFVDRLVRAHRRQDWVAAAAKQTVRSSADSVRAQSPLTVPAAPGSVDPIVMLPDSDEIQYEYSVFVNYENVLVRPFFTEDTAFSVIDTTGSVDFVDIVNFDWDMQYSPRLEVGYLDSEANLGFRVRYWHFDDTVRAGTIPRSGTNVRTGIGHVELDARGNAGHSFEAAHALDLDVFDFELMTRNQSCANTVIRSAGIRYARLDQLYTAQVFDGSGGVVEEMSSAHEIDGVGPTLAVEYRRALGVGFGMFANVRGSVLYGERNWIARESGTTSSPDAIRRVHDNDLMGVAETQLGADYRCQGWYGSVFFIRAALEGQYWAGAGTGTAINVLRDGDKDNSQTPLDAGMGFFGLSIALGAEF